MQEMRGMTVIVKTVTRWTAALIFLFGIYVIMYGHLGPGGGFAGGVVLACAYVIVMLAFSHDNAIRALPQVLASRLHKIEGAASRLDSFAGLTFLMLALVGLLQGTAFFADWLEAIYKAKGLGEEFNVVSAGIIPLANIAIGIKVCMAVFVVFFILASVRLIRKGDKIEFHSGEVG